MALSMSRLLDRWRNRTISYAGDAELADHLGRAGDSFQDFVLSATQMASISATPVTIVAAPGSGYYNVVTGLFLQVNSTGFTAFENGSGVLEFRYTGASGAQVVTDVTNAFVEASADTADWCPPVVCAPVANAVICAHSSTTVTAGTGNIQGRIWYKTVRVAEIVA